MPASFDGHVALVDTLDAAVQEARNTVIGQQAQALLLSPACASFDQYSEFEERGEHFRQLINGPTRKLTPVKVKDQQAIETGRSIRNQR